MDMARSSIINKEILSLLGLLALLGCGGVSGSSSGQGSVAITVKQAPPRTDDPVRRIREYRVIILAPDIASPIVNVFPSETTSAQIDGVPAGGGRAIEIQAINERGQLVRAGGHEGLFIRGGEIAEAVVELQAVPVVANLADGAVVENTRLRLRIVSDPSDTVIVDDEREGRGVPLVDASSALPELHLDQSTGQGEFRPGLLLPGEHRLMLRSVRTGRSSAVVIKVIDGAKRHAAPFFSASAVSVDQGIQRLLSIQGAEVR